MVITGEVVAGSGQSFTLANTPVVGSVALYGSGVRLIQGSNADYTISGASITIINAPGYSAGSVVADYLTSSTNLTQSGNDILSPLALTTLQRVKDILFDPNRTITITGDTTATSVNVINVSLPTGKQILVGQSISGAGIPTGTTIAAIVNATAIHLSAAATASNTGQNLYVVDQPTAFDGMLIRYINAATRYINNECGRFSFVQQTYVNDTYSIDNPRQSFLRLRNYPVFWISSFQWRAGTPTNPSWTSFIGDQYELINPETNPIDGTVYYPSGMVRVYGVLPRIYNNMIRASYVGGYPVNWNNAEDLDTHWLPADITGVCENLVVRRFKRRQLAGKSSVSLEGATESWRNTLDQDDLDVLGQYRDLKF